MTTPRKRSGFFDPAIGTRLQEIREACGLKLREFSDAMLEKTGFLLTESELSRRELGRRGVNLDELPAIAAMDPDGRGVHWLLYGVKSDPTLVAGSLDSAAGHPPKRATTPIEETDVTNRLKKKRPGNG